MSQIEKYGDFSWIDWQTMDTYKAGDVVLTIMSADRMLFGFQRDGLWYEIFQGQEVAQSLYRPVEWTHVPKRRWRAYTSG